MHQKSSNPLNINENPMRITAQTQKKIFEVNPQQKAVETSKISDICFNNLKHKTQLASIDVSGILKIWDIAKGPHGKVIQTFSAQKIWLTSVDIEKQDGRKIVCGTLDGKLLMFEINNAPNKGKNFQKDKANVEMTGHQGAVQCLQFLSPQYIIAGSTDANVSIWDLDNPQRYLSIHQYHTGDVQCLHAFEGDSNIVLSGSTDLTCKIWDIRVKKPVQAEYKGHESAVNTVKFLPLGNPTTFVTGSDDATINLWDLRMKDPVTSFQDNEFYDAIYSIAVSPSGRYLFAASENSKLKVFDMLGDVDPINSIDVGIVMNDGLIKSIDISADGYAIGMVLGSKGNHKDLTVIY